MRSRLLGPSSAWESKLAGKSGAKSFSKCSRFCWRRQWTRLPKAARWARKAGKKGVCICTVLLLCYLDGQVKMNLMKNRSSLTPLEQQYDRLRKSLAQIGYISQGSVLARSVATSGRSGYQWTRKVAQKTITVSLSRQQFAAMKQAVQNERKLWNTIQQMEKVSRQILFESLPDTRRRKRLAKKVWALSKRHSGHAPR